MLLGKKRKRVHCSIEGVETDCSSGVWGSGILLEEWLIEADGV